MQVAPACLVLQGLHQGLPVLGVDGVLPLVAQRQDDLAHRGRARGRPGPWVEVQRAFAGAKRGHGATADQPWQQCISATAQGNSPCSASAKAAVS